MSNHETFEGHNILNQSIITHLRESQSGSDQAASIGSAHASSRVPTGGGSEPIISSVAVVLGQIRHVVEALRIGIDELIQEAKGLLSSLQTSIVRQGEDSSHHRARGRGASDASKVAVLVSNAV